MKAITLRNIPPELMEVIRRKAEEQRISFSKVVIRLLEESLGRRGERRKSRPRHEDLDGLAGAWTEDEAAVFDEALARQRAIDEDLWK